MLSVSSTSWFIIRPEWRCQLITWRKELYDSSNTMTSQSWHPSSSNWLIICAVFRSLVDVLMKQLRQRWMMMEVSILIILAPYFFLLQLNNNLSSEASGWWSSWSTGEWWWKSQYPILIILASMCEDHINKNACNEECTEIKMWCLSKIHLLCIEIKNKSRICKNNVFIFQERFSINYNYYHVDPLFHTASSSNTIPENHTHLRKMEYDY